MAMIPNLMEDGRDSMKKPAPTTCQYHTTKRSTHPYTKSPNLRAENRQSKRRQRQRTQRIILVRGVIPRALRRTQAA